MEKITRESWEINGEQVFCWINGTQYYCTNERGEGIFFVDQVRNDRRQLAGTCQFSVRGLKRESKKDKLRRWIAESDSSLMKHRFEGRR